MSIVARIDTIEKTIAQEAQPRLSALQGELKRLDRARVQTGKSKLADADASEAAVPDSPTHTEHEAAGDASGAAQSDDREALLRSIRDAEKTLADLKSELRDLRAENRKTAILAMLVLVTGYFFALILGYDV